MNPKRHEQLRSQIPPLATGDLAPFAAWRLWRHIARCTECAREWREVSALYANLRALPQPRVTRHVPAWPITEETREATGTPTITFGGITMKRRTVAVATAALCLSLTGAVAARQWWSYNPLQNFSDKSGQIWKATSNFKGEVKMYDVNNKSLGSHGTDGREGAPIAATVTVDGKAFSVEGKGRHEIRDEAGRLLGYAELVPETTEERAELWKEHDRRLGIDERLSMNYGSMDGFGMANGFLGEGEKAVHWDFHGVGEAQFRRVDNGHIVMRGKASPVTPELRARLRRDLGPVQYAASVAPETPKRPVFTWTINGRKEHHVGLGSFPLTLADGTELTVEVKEWQDGER